MPIVGDGAYPLAMISVCVQSESPQHPASDEKAREYPELPTTQTQGHASS